MSRGNGVTPYRRSTLRRWNQLSNFIRLICYTGFVKNGRPQSVILVAEPGEGKTELLERFRPNAFLGYYSDMTMRTVISELKKAARGQTTHIVCTELQKVIMRKKAVAESTLTIILQAMEDGVHRVGYGPVMHDLHGARMGLLAATTVTSVRKNPFIVSDLAMDSRCYMIDAKGTREEILEIERRIAEGDVSALKPIAISAPTEPIKVEIAPKLAHKMREWVQEMHRKQIRTYGVRTFSRFMHTIRGVALSEGRDVVKQSDLDHLYTFKNLWLDLPVLPEDEVAD